MSSWLGTHKTHVSWTRATRRFTRCRPWHLEMRRASTTICDADACRFRRTGMGSLGLAKDDHRCADYIWHARSLHIGGTKMPRATTRTTRLCGKPSMEKTLHRGLVATWQQQPAHDGKGLSPARLASAFAIARATQKDILSSVVVIEVGRRPTAQAIPQSVLALSH